MKVQTDVLGVRFSTLLCGDTFKHGGCVYLKTTLLNENNYYSVELETGVCYTFYDDTIVTPIKLMAVPEKQFNLGWGKVQGSTLYPQSQQENCKLIK